MTPNLKAAINAIQPLTPTERQQLIQILHEDTVTVEPEPNLQALSSQFWQGITLKQLFTKQPPKTIPNVKALAISFWPKEDSTEDFLSFLRQQRQEMV